LYGENNTRRLTIIIVLARSRKDGGATNISVNFFPFYVGGGNGKYDASGVSFAFSRHLYIQPPENKSRAPAEIRVGRTLPSTRNFRKLLRHTLIRSVNITYASSIRRCPSNGHGLQAFRQIDVVTVVFYRSFFIFDSFNFLVPTAHVVNTLGNASVRERAARNLPTGDETATSSRQFESTTISQFVVRRE